MHSRVYTEGKRRDVAGGRERLLPFSFCLLFSFVGMKAPLCHPFVPFVPVVRAVFNSRVHTARVSGSLLGAKEHEWTNRRTNGGETRQGT
jgi:hypothetical protein